MAGGYFDLQINGYAGVDFQNDGMTVDDLRRACATLREHGNDAILATIVTEHIPIMARRLRKLVEYRERDPLVREVIIGIHIEGPFLSPIDGYRGAHPKDAIRPADREALETLLDAARGLTKLVTLAPENDPGLKMTRLLSSRGIRVSAGHTNASMDELRAAIDAGLSMFTHLGNGCPMQIHRHENIVQRALSLSDQLWLMFIADGAHVAFPALKNYLRAAGLDRCIVVTDAVAPAGMGPGRYRLGRWDLLIGEDLVARAPDGSHLVGSAMTMPQALARLTDQIGLTREQAALLTVHNPRRVMGYESDKSDKSDNADQRGDRGAGSQRVGHPRQDAPARKVEVLLPGGSGNRQPGIAPAGSGADAGMSGVS